MTAPDRPRILHLVSARGGGMTRFARDLLAPGDALLHAGDDAWVLERHPAAEGAQFLPYHLPTAATGAADWLDALLDAHALDALHLHHLAAATLPLLEAWAPRGRPWLASLHDVGYRSARAFEDGAALPPVDPAWAARCARVLATAGAISAPSRFLAEDLGQACPGLHAHVLAPGVASHRAAEPGRVRPLRSIAVLGALGAHKGKDRLLKWLAHPDAGAYRWTLIGYTEDQLQPGWLADGRLWVHGPFQPQDTVHWLRHYQVDLVLFPNRLAESFSYALSDAWSAGVPVLAPNCGALGERVRAHSGGGLIADPDDAGALLRQLCDLADGRQLAAWRTRIGTEGRAMVASIDDMRADMQALYRRLPAAAPPAADALNRLQPWLRSQLDDVVFRHENIRLARDYAQVREWADKLEQDLQRLRGDTRAQLQARTELELQLTVRDRAIAELRSRNARVEADAAALGERNARVEADAAALAAAHARARTEFEKAQQALQELGAQAAELSARNAVLMARTEAAAQQLDGRDRRIAELDGEVHAMYQRINALEDELQPLRIKGARYDRALGWIPAGLRRLARMLLRQRRERLAAGAAR